jgi:hypothetical protein
MRRCNHCYGQLGLIVHRTWMPRRVFHFCAESSAPAPQGLPRVLVCPDGSWRPQGPGVPRRYHLEKQPEPIAVEIIR